MAGGGEGPGRLEFNLLGPFVVTSGDVELALGGEKQRVLLAHLLLNANRTVPAGQLAEVLWPEHPPRSAKANLQTYVWRLRQLIPGGPSGAELITHAGGYSLVTERELIDSCRFEELIDAAAEQRDRGHAHAALDLLERAERWWRGAPLEDLPTAPQWQPELSRLTEVRSAAVEQRLAVQIALGRCEPAIAQASGLLDHYPYREQLWQQYMIALAQAGRRAEALHAYTRARDRMITDLGVEPGPALRAVQDTILRGEVPDARIAATAEFSLGEQIRLCETASPVYQLPPDVPDFTGRAEHVRALEAWLCEQHDSASPRVVVLSGPPGVGKSALAVHVAHRLRGRFGDGQFYVDLTGTGSTIRDPNDVLAEFLHALGVAGAAQPSGTSARTAMLRSRLTGRRVLMVLDDAATAQQVRPLLPADGGCAVLVTARSRLPELPGSRQWDLDVLDPEDARAMLVSVAGADRVGSDVDEAASIVRLCDHLPLAIRVAGVRLAGRQTWSLRTLHDRLVDESSRLGELRVGDLAVRSSFELSVRQLPDPVVRAFGLLSLGGRGDVPTWLVESLFGGSHPHDTLDALVDANLVGLAGRGPGDEPRYRLHDLLRCFAAEIAAAEPPRTRHAALTRMLTALLDWECGAASRMPAVFGAFPPPSAGAPLPARAESCLADPLAWFGAERRTVINAVTLAAENGLDELAWKLAVTAVPFFDLRGYYDDWQRTHETALGSVRATTNTTGEAQLLRGLGQVHLYRGECDEAEHRMRQAADGFRQVGNLWGESVAVAGLGTVARVRGNTLRALEHYHAALGGLDASGDLCGQSQVRNSIGSIHVLLGEHDQAQHWLDEAKEIAVAMRDGHREAKVLIELGGLHRERGAWHQSLTCFRRARDIVEALGDERCTAYALLGLGQTLSRMGDSGRGDALSGRAQAVFLRFRGGNRRASEAEPAAR